MKRYESCCAHYQLYLCHKLDKYNLINVFFKLQILYFKNERMNKEVDYY